jgi:iron complex outermembrane receptor protein
MSTSCFGRVLGALITAALAPTLAAAATSPDSSEVAPVTVIAATPLPGVPLDVARAPYAVRTLAAPDLRLDGLADAAGALATRIGAVNVDDDLDDAFQPDVLYRGFEASPVLGVSQGLAVYQNGVRINEAFGDTVNWDLIPSAAIARLDVVGANPLYGLNALGGAIALTMKTGFDAPGGALDVSGGSFGRRAVDVSFGAHDERFGAFVAVRGLGEDGWRLRSPDRLGQAYAVVSARGERLSLDLALTAADNRLRGEGAAPVQELAVSRALVFTSPQLSANRLIFLTASGTYRASASLSLQSDAYVRDVRQDIANGNTTEYGPCALAALLGRLCQPDGATPLRDTAGGLIPDLSAGGARLIGENDREGLRTLAYGVAIQATSTALVANRRNQLAVGGAFDGARTDFASSAELGLIDNALVVQPSGFFVSTPEGTPFNATPVGLLARDAAYGGYVTDTLDLSPRLSLTASGRFNTIRVALADRLGTRLSGLETYARVNPGIGLSYQFSPRLSAYAGYAEGSRAPTASEIECSDPRAPCLLPSSLSADPPRLRQVVSQTFEAGLRGGRDVSSGRLSVSLGLYRTRVVDDIYGVATSLNAGYFKNIPGDVRQGVDIDVEYRDRYLTAYLSYAYVDAAFSAGFLEPSPANPFHDASGDIQVRRGDRLPGIPANRLKLGGDYGLSTGLTVGADLQATDSQVYRGDEANRLAPLPGYVVLGLRASYPLGRGVGLFAGVQNALNARYATFGLLGDPTGAGAPGVPLAGSGVDTRFQSPAAPLAVYGGVSARF